jgi:hypothetical protein
VTLDQSDSFLPRLNDRLAIGIGEQASDKLTAALSFLNNGELVV